MRRLGSASPLLNRKPLLPNGPETIEDAAAELLRLEHLSGLH